MLSEIKKFINIRNPLFRFFLFLSIFSIISTLDIYLGTKNSAERTRMLLNIIMCAGFGSSFYYVSRYILNFRTVNPFNVFISTLLVYLLVHPSNSPLLFFLVFVGIFIGKYFLKKSNLPIVNPAAFGLFFCLYLSKLLVSLNLIPDSLLISWWGADMQQQLFTQLPLVNVMFAVALLLSFLYFTQAFRKFNYAVTFFLSYIFCFFIYNILVTHQPAETIHVVSQAFFNSVAFLALVMIPEPKTSPITPTHQIVVGMFGGLALFLYSAILVRYVAEPFTTTILTANIMTLIAKLRRT